MQPTLDPYRDWLGVDAPERPLDYYQLLGLPRFEADPHRIGQAEMLSTAKVLRYERGEHASMSRRLMQEIDTACATLSDPQNKAAYDAQLRANIAEPALPDYYHLLELPQFETSVERIETAHMIQMGNLLRDEAQIDPQTLAECRAALEAALATLTDREKKSAYDAALRAHSAVDTLSDPQAATGVSGKHNEPAPTTLDLSIPDEEEDLLSTPAHISAPAAIPMAAMSAVAQRDTAARASGSYSAASDNGDVGLVEPPPAQTKSVKSPSHDRVELLKQFRTSATAPPPPKRAALPEIPIKQIGKIGGALVVACLALYSGMKLLAGGPPTGQLAGRILLKGQPVVGADMQFVPADNPEDLYIGVSIAGGEYQVSYRTFDGLPVGQYNVTITHFELPDGKTLGEGEEGEVQKDDAKAAFYSFESQVERGSNSLDFDLAKGKRITSKP
jgi:hypothetical protein